MRAGDLTTLGNVKQWLGIEPSNTNSDDLLNRLIRSASAFVLNYVQRPSIGLMKFEDVYDGRGNAFMVLRQYPVHSILALSLMGSPVQAATGDGITSAFSNGFVLESADSTTSQQRLSLFGKVFPRARQSVYVSYMAGYVVRNEPQVVGDTNSPTFNVFGTWLSDVSVTLADGTPLTLVTGTPAPMQYQADDGLYTFNAAQAEDQVLVTYSYVPSDIEQAVWEMVGERFKAKDRIGYSSKTLGGQETVAFDTRSMTPYVRELLEPYKRVAPV